MSARVTRNHRAAAATAVGAQPGTTLWDDFVEHGDDSSWDRKGTLSRHAQTIADITADSRHATLVAFHTVHAGDFETIHEALFTGRVSMRKVDGQRALIRIIKALKDE